MGWTVYNSDGQILQGSSTLADDAVTTAKILNLNVTNAKVATGIDAVKLADGTVTNAELQRINSLTENVQTRMNTNTTAIATKAAVGSGTPSTQTLPDTAATGSSTEAARLDHIHAMPAAGGVVTREGGSLLGEGGAYANGSYTYDIGSEAATTSTSAVDLLGATSLTLDAISPYCLMFGARKTSGAADDGGVGFKENTTVILEATGGSNILWRSNASNEAQEGGIFEFVSARQTNYLNGNMYGGSVTMATAGQARENRSGPATDYANSHLNAQTTSFILRGIMDNSSNTLAVDELHLYSFATS